MFHIFHFLQSVMVFEVTKLYVFNAISSEKRCLSSHSFAVSTVNIEAGEFSHLLNPDWSIQISGTAVCIILLSG